MSLIQSVMAPNNSVMDPATPPPDPPASFPQAEGESDRAFEAFRAYLELGPQRRYAAAARRVGASLRTVKRWAQTFDWRGRIKAHASRCAEHYAETERAVQSATVRDAAERAQALRDRQYALAEALFDAAERYLASQEEDERELLTFADACKAMEVASRLGQQATHRAGEETASPGQSLRDQLTALLDQACRDTTVEKAGNTPSASTGVISGHIGPTQARMSQSHP